MNIKLPQVLNDARVYLDDSFLIGHGEVTLPEIQFMSENVKVAGVAGELDMPVIGHLQSMKCTINWSIVTDSSVSLAAPETRMITVRGSQQIYNPNTGVTETQAIAVTMKVHPKTVQLGKFTKGSPTDTSNEFEVLMIKVVLDGDEVLLADKMNYIFRVDGTDYLADVRSDLGME